MQTSTPMPIISVYFCAETIPKISTSHPDRNPIRPHSQTIPNSDGRGETWLTSARLCHLSPNFVGGQRLPSNTVKSTDYERPWPELPMEVARCSGDPPLDAAITCAKLPPRAIEFSDRAPDEVARVQRTSTEIQVDYTSRPSGIRNWRALHAEEMSVINLLSS